MLGEMHAVGRKTPHAVPSGAGPTQETSIIVSRSFASLPRTIQLRIPCSNLCLAYRLQRLCGLVKAFKLIAYALGLRFLRGI
jgi:hypothetical protein